MLDLHDVTGAKNTLAKDTLVHPRSQPPLSSRCLLRPISQAVSAEIHFWVAGIRTEERGDDVCPGLTRSTPPYYLSPLSQVLHRRVGSEALASFAVQPCDEAETGSAEGSQGKMG